jgi:hypothetical protein
MDVMKETLKQIKRLHHTKDKGDLGVAKAYCDLVERVI